MVTYAQFVVSHTYPDFRVLYPDFKVRYPDFMVSYAQFVDSHTYPDFRVLYPDFRVSYHIIFINPNTERGVISDPKLTLFFLSGNQ